MDERERDKFYSAPDAAADDAEYELEPPDPTVLSAEDRHAKEVADATRLRVDIDEIYSESERQFGGEMLEQWLRNFHFRFQVKHLFIATAVLAIALTLSRFGLLLETLLILGMLSIIGLYVYVQRQERKQQAEAERKREELYARCREQLGKQGSATALGEPSRPAEAVPQSAPVPPNEIDEIWQEARKQEAFRFRFSLRELIIAMTFAAVLLGMIRIFGGAAPTATILGTIAFAGLVAHALGFEPPQMVILGWWFVLVFYVFLIVFSAIWR